MNHAVKVKTLKKVKPKKKTVKTKAIAIREKTMPTNIDAGKVTINPEALLMAAVKNGASMDILERLLNMSDHIKKDQAETEYREAMAKFQAECPIIIKGTKVLNKDGKTTRYAYAQIDAIVKEVKPYLLQHGFSYQIKSIMIEKPFTGITATAISHHIGGHSEESSFSTPIDQTMVENKYMTLSQAWLAAQSFARRIAFCNLFGLMTGEDDNDGNKLGNPDDPEANKKAAEEAEIRLQEEKERAEVLKNLPQDIKDAFKALGYADKNDKGKAAYLFCKGHKFNNDMILKHLNMLADKA